MYALSTPARPIRENVHDENSTPRSAMTLTRREQLERWRESKKQKQQVQPLALVDENTQERQKISTPKVIPEARPVSESTSQANSSAVVVENTPNKSFNASALMIEPSFDSLLHDSEQDLQEPMIESRACSSGTSETSIIDEESNTIDPVVHETKLNVDNNQDTSDQTIMCVEEVVESVPNEIGTETADTGRDELEESLSGPQSPHIVIGEPLADNGTKAENGMEYDVNLLLLANDTLVHELAACEARHHAECAALRQERDHLRLELELQEARYKNHIQRLEKSSRESLATMMEHIEELSKQLAEAHKIINLLKDQKEPKAEPNDRPRRSTRRSQRE